MKEKHPLTQSDGISYQGLVNDIRSLIESGRRNAYAAINQAAVFTYWHIGEKIVEEEQDGHTRAEYGKQIIRMLADDLPANTGVLSANGTLITIASSICRSKTSRL